jgi:hypothetical protein
LLGGDHLAGTEDRQFLHAKVHANGPLIRGVRVVVLGLDRRET